MNDVLWQYGILTLVFGLVKTASYLFGAVVCLIHRRISRWLIVVSVGFAAEFLVTIFRLTDAMILQFFLGPLLPTSLIYLGMNLLDSLAKVAVVVGLAMAFSDVRRKLALSRGQGDESD